MEWVPASFVDAEQVDTAVENGAGRQACVTSRSALGTQETALVSLHQPLRHLVDSAVDRDRYELGRRGLPLRATVTGVAAGHLPLRDCHGDLLGRRRQRYMKMMVVTKRNDWTGARRLGDSLSGRVGAGVVAGG